MGAAASVVAATARYVGLRKDGRAGTQLHAAELTIGEGTSVPEFMKGKTVDVVVDLADIRRRLDGVGVCLVGMAGCGMRQTAKNLSDALQYAPMDTHAVLESVTGETAAAVLLRDGKAEFIAAEKDIIAEIAAYRRVVLTTGADVVMEKFVWGDLQHFVTVYLDAPARRLAATLEAEGADAVYLFDHETGCEGLSGSLEQRLEGILGQRASTYAQADITVDADARADVVALRVTQALARMLDDNADHIDRMRQRFEAPAADQ